LVLFKLKKQAFSNMKYLIFLLIGCIIFTSCANEHSTHTNSNTQSSSNTQQVNHESLDCIATAQQSLYQFSWVPKDTLLFDYLGMVELWDFDSKTQRYLSRDWLTKNVMEFSVNGKLLNQWNFTGSGPEGVGGEIYGGTYIGDSAFVILGDKGYHFYNRKGKFINKISFGNKVSLGTISLLTKIFLYDKEGKTMISSQIIANADQYNGTMREFYEYATLLSEFVLSDPEEDFSHYIKYPSSSIYKNENGYTLSGNDVYMEMDKLGNMYAIFACEAKIFQYDIKNSYKMKTCLNTAPDHFDHLPLFLPYNQLSSDNQSFQAFVGTSKYQSIYTFQDSLIGLVYSRGLAENLITNKLTRTTYNDSLYQFNAYYFQVFAGMKKLCNDIKFPKGTSTISYVHTLDKVVFSADVDQLKYEPEGSLFYVYSLQAATDQF